MDLKKKFVTIIKKCAIEEHRGCSISHTLGRTLQPGNCKALGMKQENGRLDRREFLGMGLGALVVNAASSAVAQEQRAFFTAPVTGRQNVVGLGADKSVPEFVYNAVANYLNRKLGESQGRLSISNSLGEYSVVVSPQQQRSAIDFIRTITRDIVRERHSGITAALKRGEIKEQDGERRAIEIPKDEEIARSIDHVLTLRRRYRDVPLHMSVYSADREANGRSFGVPSEIDFWNRTNKAHGLASLSGPHRHEEPFLKAIVATAPSKHKDGTLHFAIGFNGHGAERGAGMSLHSDGSSRFYGGLMSARTLAKALADHCDTHKQIYEDQHKSGKSAYIQVLLFCCFSQDQSRSTDGHPGSSLLSQLESLSHQYKVRPMVLTVGEFGKPGYYEPGTQIPVLGVRALANLSDHKKGLLTFGDLYDSAAAGGEGIVSNPTGFVTDVRRHLLFQAF